jgi:hypothetical protein
VSAGITVCPVENILRFTRKKAVQVAVTARRQSLDPAAVAAVAASLSRLTNPDHLRAVAALVRALVSLSVGTAVTEGGRQ